MVLLYELNIIYFYFKDKGDCWLWILLRDYTTNKPGTKGDKNKTILV